MAWAVPEHRPEDVNAAARVLSKMSFPVDEAQGVAALGVLNNWRASHSYPLNTFQITLRHKARRIEKGAIVAQRSKRLESIHRKLVDKPTMRLTQMQDIAGCRAILLRLRSVARLVQLYKNAKFDHEFKSEKDYINHPKPDGYRCHHLVFEYTGHNKTASYTGLKIEIQIRTQLQHNWATAVEAVGIFTNQALKSNRGNADWLRFFALMGSVAAAIEGTPHVPNSPVTKSDLRQEIQNLVAKLRVRESLQVYNTTIDALGAAKDAKYFIIELNPDTLKVSITRYKAKESADANRDYTLRESRLAEGSTTQIVLVSSDNISALKKAYPNYFLDTNLFAKLVDRAVLGDFPEPQPAQLTLAV